MKKSKSRAPTHLQSKTKAWWSAVVFDYELEEHHQRLLTLAGQAWDRGQQARKILDKEGLIYFDRFGQPKSRPEVSVERDSRLSFARLIRELCLDSEPDDARSPRTNGRKS